LASALDLDREQRRALFAELCALLDAPPPLVSPTGGPRPHLDLASPVDPLAALRAVAEGLCAGQVHPTNPRYFGLNLPTPATVAVVAEALVAARNPQLATHGHAPFAVELEAETLRAIARRLGLEEPVEGTFTTGAAEANLMAVATALVVAHPEVVTGGVRALAADPTLYASAEAHPTVTRAARLAGLGADAVRTIPTDATHRLKLRALHEALAHDRAAGKRPLLVVATAGTTSGGTFDPLDEIVEAATRAGAQVHVDAAYGGLAGFVPELAPLLAGVGRADSVAFDPHKALAVPLGAGVFLTRRPGALAATFGVRAGYMPRGATRDPYALSPRWSRRFVGLPTYLVLATLGEVGVAAFLREQVALADRLRERLTAHGFRVVNDTRLPIVCFVDGGPLGDGAAHLERLRRAAIAGDDGWTSLVHFANGKRALRACITSHRTTAADVDRLVDALVTAREPPR